MASVLDVAKYVLVVMGKCTTWQLQKLCYYCQAWSLVWEEVPLFPEDFEAWANGPVCPELFARHKGHFNVDASLFADLPDYPFSGDERETMDVVLHDYGGYAPYELRELTHLEAPWREARRGVPVGKPSQNVISKESMQRYYGELYDAS